jgi:hypothetical protein
MDELPRLRAQAAWNEQRLEPHTPPGSVEEEDALAELDAQRQADDRALEDTPEMRARRSARHWRRQSRRA